MHPNRYLISAAAMATALLTTSVHAATSQGKVLIVLPAANAMPLKNGKTFATGYYLNELVIPARRLAEAGYELVFATPGGKVATVDAASVNASYFGNSEAALEEAQAYQRTLPGLSHPHSLAQLISGGLGQYQAVFVPGGPAPTVDLMASRELGTILNYFHQHQRVTVLLCHAPTALLAATTDPVGFQAAMRTGDTGSARKLANGWPYAGYRMTVFSNDEEAQAAQYVFKGEPLFTPRDALTLAGADVVAAPLWQPNVVRDRELITGQNPASDAMLVEAALKALAEQAAATPRS
jgi:putative intracellular protease/amidase